MCTIQYCTREDFHSSPWHQSDGAASSRTRGLEDSRLALCGVAFLLRQTPACYCTGYMNIDMVTGCVYLAVDHGAEDVVVDPRDGRSAGGVPEPLV